MPGKGYATVGLKPAIIAKLQNVTDKNYPGMFLPSTLIIMMNEIKRGHYSVESHRIRLDLSGRYNTMTIRADIQQWLEANHAEFGEEYYERYRVRCFTKFVSYFIANMIESKFDSQNCIINLKEADFEWLQTEYKKQKSLDGADECVTFERFADTYINGLLGRIREAKKILAV